MAYKIKLVSACVIGVLAVLLILILNNFKWGRKLCDWLLD